MVPPALKQPAPKRMTVEEFLAWNPGDGLRYELVDGWPVAQSAPSTAHGRIAANLTIAIGNRLRAGKRPCVPENGGGLRIDPRWSVRIPDLLVRCGKSREQADTPVLAIEILSPSNSASEMARKREDYRSVGIVEVVEVEQDEAVVRVHRLQGKDWVIQSATGLDAVVPLRSIDLDIPLAEVYDAVSFDPPAERSAERAQS